MSEHFKFGTEQTGQIAEIVIEKSWEASVPVEPHVAQALGQEALFAATKTSPLCPKPGYDGVPGPTPVAVPSINLRVPFAR